MPDADPRLITIFGEALGRPDRAAYLDRACADDAGLRLRVEALLAANDGAHDAPRPGPTDATNTFQPEAPRPVTAATGEPTTADADATGPHVPVSSLRRGQGTAGGDGLGTVIAGRYTLVDVIGEGGMGSVYLASQTEPVKRQVALKLIKCGGDSREVLARFDAERQALALMDHPSIARVYDGGTTPSGQPFFVMELVRGVPLTRFCDTQRLSVEARLHLFVQVCQAVQHAHQKGVIHRDLKPGNVLVTEVDGKPVPKVIDFGVAKATEQKLTDLSIADVGAIVGTPAYMSPEQADPTSRDIDTRTDVYALGVMLYELLTGSPPIDARQFQRGAILEMLRMVREVEPPQPSAKLAKSEALPEIAAKRGVEPARLMRAVRGDLDWIVMKALEKDRTRRYETANGLAADVLRHLAHEPVVAAPPSRAYRMKKFVRKHRGAVIAAGVVALVLVAGIAGTTWGLLEARNQELEARNQEQLAREEAAEKELARGEEARQRRRADLTVTDMLTARGLLAQDRDAPAEAALWYAAAADQAGVAGDDDRQQHNRARARNALRQAPIPLAALELRGANLLTHELRSSVRLEFLPQGDLLLIRLGDKKSFLWSWRDGKLLPWIEALTNIGAFCVSPDGAFLALGFPSGVVQVRRVADGQLVGSERLPHTIHSLAYSPDGRLLAIGADQVRLWDARGQSLLKPIALHPQPVTTLVFNRAGNRLITVSGGWARVFAVDPGQQYLEPLHAPMPHSSVTPPVLTSDDRTLMTVDHGLNRWDLETGKLLARPSRGRPVDPGSILSPNGNWWAKASGPPYRVSVQQADETQPAGQPTHAHIISGIAFNSTGDALSTSSYDGTARLWSMPDGRPISQPLEHTGGWVLACAWSADDRHLATVESSVVRVWRRPDRSRAAILDTWGWRPRLSPDGRLVAPGFWHEGPVNNDAQLLQQLQVVNTDDGKLVGPGVPLSSHLIDACLGWDNRTVAATWIGDKFGVWDVATAKAAFEPIRLPGRGLSIAARPASPHFAVRCSNHLLVIDGRTGQTALEILTAHNSVVREYVRYTPDGRSLVHKRDWTISIHDADTGQLRFPPLQPQKGGVCRSIAVSADSRLLATVTGDPNFAQVWDLTTGRAASPPLHHPGEFWGLFSVRFSPDGRHLLTGHKDGQVRYWDWQTGRLACPPMAHSNEVYDAAITPDGRFAVTAVRGEPWHIEVWELTTGKRIASPVHLPLEVWELTTGKWIAAPPLAPRGINGATMGCARLTITPDGRRALVTSQYQHLAVVDLEALLSQPPMPTAELKQQAELATSHRLEAGDRNRLSLDDWKRLWAALPRHGPQRPWLQASGWPPDPKLTVDQTLSFLNQRLKQRPEDVRALYQRWEIRKDKEDRAQLIELCQRRPTGDLDEDAAFVLAEILNDLEWSPLTPVEMTAQSGTKLTLQPGGSILTAATKAARDSYRVRATSALRRITALQVQALPHRTLPEGGPGWGGGNFHLTEVRAFRQQPSQEPVPLQFATAQANYIRPRSAGARPRDGPLAVLDGDHGTRWDVHPLYGKAHWLNLCLNEAVLLSEGEQIVVELDCQDRTWPRALLGHFRLNVSGDERLTRRGLTQQIPRDLPVSAHVRLAAAYLEQGEPDQAQTTLARFEKPRFPSDHVAQPLLLIALHERLKQPRQAKEAYDLLLARLRDHAVPPALRPWALDALTSVGGLSQKDATAKLNHLALDLEWRGVTESLARRTDLNGVLRTDLHAVVRGMALLAWFGRDKEYNAVRGRLLDLAGTIEDADRAQDVVEACSLLPAGGAQQEAVLALGRRAVELGKGSGALPWFQMSLGMAQYRSGQFADAIRTLTTAGADSNQWISGTSACYRAMSLFRQGKKDEARKLAAEAARTMRPPPKDEDEVFSADHDDLILWLAHREAKALIGLEDAK